MFTFKISFHYSLYINSIIFLYKEQSALFVPYTFIILLKKIPFARITKHSLVCYKRIHIIGTLQWIFILFYTPQSPHWHLRIFSLHTCYVFCLIFLLDIGQLYFIVLTAIECLKLFDLCSISCGIFVYVGMYQEIEFSSFFHHDQKGSS